MSATIVSERRLAPAPAIIPATRFGMLPRARVACLFPAQPRRTGTLELGRSRLCGQQRVAATGLKLRQCLRNLRRQVGAKCSWWSRMRVQIKAQRTDPPAEVKRALVLQDRRSTLLWPARAISHVLCLVALLRLGARADDEFGALHSAGY